MEVRYWLDKPSYALANRERIVLDYKSCSRIFWHVGRIGDAAFDAWREEGSVWRFVASSCGDLEAHRKRASCATKHWEGHPGSEESKRHIRYKHYFVWNLVLWFHQLKCTTHVLFRMFSVIILKHLCMESTTRRVKTHNEHLTFFSRKSYLPLPPSLMPASANYCSQ